MSTPLTPGPAVPEPDPATGLGSATTGPGHPGDPDRDEAAVQAPAEQAAAARPQTPRWGPSAVTVVWGVLLLAVAVLVTGYELFGLTADPLLVGALLVAGCGLFLVVVAAVSARRRRTGSDDTAAPGG